MNLSKKAFALFLLASLTAGQAQAVTVELTTDKVVGAIAQLLEKGGNKVIQLLEKENLSAVVIGLGFTSICGNLSYDCYNAAKKSANKVDAFYLNMFKYFAMISALGIGAITIETIYNA